MLVVIWLKKLEKWQSEYSILFGKYINYETGVGLGQIEFITFHQSYSYEEFIEGYDLI